MSHLFRLDLQHLKGIQHLFPRPRGRDAPPEYGTHRTLNNRVVSWSHLGVFARIFQALAQPGLGDETNLDVSTHLEERQIETQ